MSSTATATATAPAPTSGKKNTPAAAPKSDGKKNTPVEKKNQVTNPTSTLAPVTGTTSTATDTASTSAIATNATPEAAPTKRRGRPAGSHNARQATVRKSAGRPANDGNALDITYNLSAVQKMSDDDRTAFFQKLNEGSALQASGQNQIDKGKAMIAEALALVNPSSTVNRPARQSSGQRNQRRDSNVIAHEKERSEFEKQLRVTLQLGPRGRIPTDKQVQYNTEMNRWDDRHPVPVAAPAAS